MTAVALIGCDGAGKTTVARELIATSPVRMKYLYMGIHAPSANFALPTSRWRHSRRVRAHRARGGTEAELAAKGPYRTVERGRIGAIARLAFRLSEEVFRQVVSWFFQLRGFVVIYDRHFSFEYDLSPHGADGRTLRLSERIHRWFLRRAYPMPTMVIMLDADPALLFERTAEWSVEHHERMRHRYLRRGAELERFTVVNAARPVEEVLADVRRLVLSVMTGERSSDTSL